MQELDNKFSVGDLVKAENIAGLEGLVGKVKEVHLNFCKVNFGNSQYTEWVVNKKALVSLSQNKAAHIEKQVSINRIGDKTSVTISGHLTKDDVQSILNLIF